MVNTIRSELCTLLFFIIISVLSYFLYSFAETLPFFIFGQCTHILCIHILSRKLRGDEVKKTVLNEFNVFVIKYTVKPLEVHIQPPSVMVYNSQPRPVLETGEKKSFKTLWLVFFKKETFSSLMKNNVSYPKVTLFIIQTFYTCNRIYRKMDGLTYNIKL